MVFSGGRPEDGAVRPAGVCGTVAPPLRRTTTWIEVVTAGRSAQVRAGLPLRWE
jgi:hypothetical protein